VADKDKKSGESEQFKEGDHVEWNGPGKVTGTVEKELTEPTRFSNKTYKASEEHPEYLVKSDKSGKEAIHRPEELYKTEHVKK